MEIMPEEIYPEIEGRTRLEPRRLATFFHLAGMIGPGDVAELGVGDGGATRFLARLFPERTVYAFDTFAGLPPSAREDEPELVAGLFPARADTEQYLAELPNVTIRKGIFPETARGLESKTFALVHLDADLYASTRAGLRFFWTRTEGYIVLDDFRRRETPGVEAALAEIVPNWQAHVVFFDEPMNQLTLRKECVPSI